MQLFEHRVPQVTYGKHAVCLAADSYPPCPVRRRGGARRREVVDHDADRLLAQEGVQVEAPLAGDVGHRPVLKVHDAAAPPNQRKQKTKNKKYKNKLASGNSLKFGRNILTAAG